MPYPVSLPLPPVAAVVLPETSHHALSGRDSAVASLQIEAASACPSSDCETMLPATESPPQAALLGPALSVVNSSPEPEMLLDQRLINQTPAFLPLPELDSLAQDHALGFSSFSIAPPQSRSLPPFPPAVEVAQSASEPLTQPGGSIRLDLPPGQSPPAQSPQPLEPSAAPTGGQVLTIPSPAQPPANEQGNQLTPPTQPNRAAPRRRGRTAVPIDTQTVGEVLEVKADRQEFDEQQQVFTAEGNAEIRFRRGVLIANRVQVNIPNRVAVAEGNAVLTRGSQVLRGERFTYNFGRNQGDIRTARGELQLSATGRDFNPAILSNDFSISELRQPVTERVFLAQPLQVTGGGLGPAFGFAVGTSPQRPARGTLNRLRFEADQAEFDGEQLQAQRVRLSNDPFSPPELELRSNQVTYRRLSPSVSEVLLRNPRLVFDQGFELPLLVNRFVFGRRSSGLFSIGYDQQDRDGFFIERPFEIYSSPLVAFTLTPQFLLQRAIQNGNFPSADQFGLIANLNFNFTATTSAQATANFSSLDFNDIGDNLRASFRAQQLVFNHTVALEYSYRNRLFNGSLGFQDIQSSLGFVITSPNYVLGSSQITLNYQAGVQYINAQTDQGQLFPADRNARDLSCIKVADRATTGNGCTSLTRYQAAATLSRLFYLWFGKALPATATEGLRYSPTPITPYFGVALSTTGVFSGYSNGDTQAGLTGSITLLGQFGHFSRPFLDYTAFSLGYSQVLKSGDSPFLFDRIVDLKTLSASLTQQIYGPLRFGIQIRYNLDTGNSIDTIYSLEYARRSYSFSASYSTGRQAAALSFRLNNLDWTGDPGPFSGDTRTGRSSKTPANQ